MQERNRKIIEARKDYFKGFVSKLSHFFIQYFFLNRSIINDKTNQEIFNEGESDILKKLDELKQDEKQK